MSCNCNQITCGCCGSQSTRQVCGDFEQPENSDLGRCFPYRQKMDCAAPIRPLPPCDDPNAYAEARPGLTPPFVIVATIFDENCLPILDENSLPILGPISL